MTNPLAIPLAELLARYVPGSYDQPRRTPRSAANDPPIREIRGIAVIWLGYYALLALVFWRFTR